MRPNALDWHPRCGPPRVPHSPSSSGFCRRFGHRVQHPRLASATEYCRLHLGDTGQSMSMQHWSISRTSPLGLSREVEQDDGSADANANRCRTHLRQARSRTRSKYAQHERLLCAQRPFEGVVSLLPHPTQRAPDRKDQRSRCYRPAARGADWETKRRE